MAFLRPSAALDVDLDIQGRRVYLRPPVMADFQSWFEVRAASRAHLTPWEPMWTRDELTRAAFRRRVRHYQAELYEDQGYAFFIFDVETDHLVGGLTLSHVRRGVAQTASLGYWMGAAYTGAGFMSDAVASLIPFAIGSLHLHRIEAACLPDNAASIRVLEKSGFQREGFAREYLKINGTWRDHVLFGCVAGSHAASHAASHRDGLRHSDCRDDGSTDHRSVTVHRPPNALVRS
jgi:[ribosomal protein S5]-alanine N-acetyltransferase